MTIGLARNVIDCNGGIVRVSEIKSRRKASLPPINTRNPTGWIELVFNQSMISKNPNPNTAPYIFSPIPTNRASKYDAEWHRILIAILL